MRVFIKDVGRSIEILFFWVIGFYLTVNYIGNYYESYGIQFMGNVWVNWFGISYFLLVVYISVMGLFIFKNVRFYKGFLKSKVFWFLFIVSVYIILVPFFKGENPF